MANVLSNGFSIDAFKGKFNSYGGARNYLFYVIPTFPAGVANSGEMATYLARSTTLPGKVVESLDIPFQGYTYPLGGKTTFESWSVTFMVDGRATLYQSFLDWSDLVHDPKTNKHGSPQEYMIDQRVQLLDPTSEEGSVKALMSILLIGAWPTNVGNIDLSYDGNEVATFDVEFRYIRHEREK